MNDFHWAVAADVGDAARLLRAEPGARLIAGGTNLLDLMKENVSRPTRLININRLPLGRIEETDDGGLRLGALVTNADAAYHPLVRERYPLLERAILAGASPQLRNMATMGGNVLQRTRCYYFYDVAAPCNKRAPGSGCSAIGGKNRIHAILGASAQCIAVHPSDMCVALAALDARVEVSGADGDRNIAFADFHRLPGDSPDADTNLRHDEVITAIVLPPAQETAHIAYLKIRDRSSYAFALVSVAVALKFADERIVDARIALGGVAHKPWRNGDAEAALVGKAATKEAFQAAADLVVAEAVAYPHNRFKVELARRAIVRALDMATAMTAPHPGAGPDKNIDAATNTEAGEEPT